MRTLAPGADAKMLSLTRRLTRSSESAIWVAVAQIADSETEGWSPSVGGEVSADLFRTTLNLPSGSRLTDDDVACISEVIASARP